MPDISYSQWSHELDAVGKVHLDHAVTRARTRGAQELGRLMAEMVERKTPPDLELVRAEISADDEARFSEPAILELVHSVPLHRMPFLRREVERVDDSLRAQLEDHYPEDAEADVAH